jgi:hypothetical protein
MIEFLSGTPSWYSIDELPPVFKVTEAKPTVNQWATVATASSQYSTGAFSASKATGYLGFFYRQLQKYRICQPQVLILFQH